MNLIKGLIASALVLSSAVSVQAEILQRIDFENGWRGIADLETNGDGIKGQITRTPVAQGNYSARFGFPEGRGDYDRSELRSNLKNRSGEEYWHSWSVFIPEDFDTNSPELVTAQLHGWGEYLRAGRFFQIQIRRGKWHLWHEFQQDPNKKIPKGSRPGQIGAATYRKDLGSVRKGRWTTFVVQAKWTHQPDGFMNLWIDGQKVLSRRGSTWWNQEMGPFFKAGAYTRASHGNSFLFLDDIKIGDRGSSYQEMVGRTPAQSSQNIALNKPVWTTAEQPENPGKHAVDGNPDTRWSARGYGNKLLVKLADKPIPIRRIEIFPYRNRAYQYLITGKNGGPLIADLRGNTRLGKISIPVNATVQYVEIEVTGCRGSDCSMDNWISLNEVRVFN